MSFGNGGLLKQQIPNNKLAGKNMTKEGGEKREEG